MTYDLLVIINTKFSIFCQEKNALKPKKYNIILNLLEIL